VNLERYTVYLEMMEVVDAALDMIKQFKEGMERILRHGNAMKVRSGSAQLQEQNRRLFGMVRSDDRIPTNSPDQEQQDVVEGPIVASTCAYKSQSDNSTTMTAARHQSQRRVDEITTRRNILHQSRSHRTRNDDAQQQTTPQT